MCEGDKNKRDTLGANEIVTCTNCGPNPCTHSANNGCATEVCGSDIVRKKEPPHPIRVAKTIDVIARITFPCAYAKFGARLGRGSSRCICLQGWESSYPPVTAMANHCSPDRLGYVYTPSTLCLLLQLFITYNIFSLNIATFTGTRAFPD
ncbi:hypothetical protein PR048_016645 [Dryococelus australis]|uniref:Uncharacterized protein n=1 Tax=Dryococelus australis TaxID=614101 RepID=A0ABQ9H7A5_9NEOP|nr:hypothetical protein PR048_016645 [Dryococelus australis]